MSTKQWLAAILIAAILVGGIPTGVQVANAAPNSVGCNMVITDAANLAATDTYALFGAHARCGIGYKYNSLFAKTNSITLHPENVLVLLLDRKDPLQNILPVGINNVSGRPGHGPAKDVVLTIPEVLAAVNAVSGSETVRVDQVVGIVVIPMVNYRKGLNWDWAEAAHDLLGFLPGGDRPLENFSTGNVDGVNPVNITTVWAHFGASTTTFFPGFGWGGWRLPSISFTLPPITGTLSMTGSMPISMTVGDPASGGSLFIGLLEWTIH